MKNQEIARLFAEMGDLLEIKGDNPFKIRAYRRAALNIGGLAQPVEGLSREELRAIPGIGEDLAVKIETFLQSGVIPAHDRLIAELPPGILELLAVPGIGPKTAKHLVEELKVTSLDELERLAQEHRLAGLPGIQQKTEENILKGIAGVKRGQEERQPLGVLLPVAEEIVAQLQRVAGVGRIEIAGSLRRRRETIRDIDIVAAASDAEAVMAAFVGLPEVERVTMHGPTRSSVVLRSGAQVDLRVVEAASFGAALAYLTGSKGHNIRLRDLALRQGLKLNEYGIFREADGARLGGEAEEDVYRLLGLPFIPPELREDLGEVEAAQAGRLPRLLEPGDIRGDLHCHSRWSDGFHTVGELAQAARARGYAYFALTDHSYGLGVAHGLSSERLREQLREVAALNRRLEGFTVLTGTETDIRADGSLDFPDELLAELDVVVASIHSGFNEPQAQLTGRIVAAMRNPHVAIIAHPTGRLLGEREAYPLDMDEILRVAAETGTALEINSYPLRLDLSDRHARRAKELGVSLAINCDVHVLNQFDSLHYGVAVARRAWLEQGNVLNTLELPELKERLGLKRRKNDGR